MKTQIIHLAVALCLLAAGVGGFTFGVYRHHQNVTWAGKLAEYAKEQHTTFASCGVRHD